MGPAVGLCGEFVGIEDAVAVVVAVDAAVGVRELVVVLGLVGEDGDGPGGGARRGGRAR